MNTQKKVNAYDAKTNAFYGAEFTIEGDNISLRKISDDALDTNQYLSPGWIDPHTHLFDEMGVFGAKADDMGVNRGVHMVVDAGTIGAYTIDTFRKYVLPTIETKVKVFLNISPIGCLFQGENIVLQMMDADHIQNTIECVRRNLDIVVGVKVRMDGRMMSDEQLRPLGLAERVAYELKMPLMLHVAQPPPKLSDMEPYLKKGDIITHCFSGQRPGLWEDDGRPTRALQACLDRGVRLDIGHGAGSFSFDVFDKALAHGLPKVTMGTDLHRPSMAGPVKTMSNFVSKMYGLRLPLNEIIWGLTQGPADILGLEGWCDLDKSLKNLTLFEIAPDDERRPQMDTVGQVRYFNHIVKVTGVVYDGEFRPINDTLPEPAGNERLDMRNIR